jgi:hypothetical protein
MVWGVNHFRVDCTSNFYEDKCFSNCSEAQWLWPGLPCNSSMSLWQFCGGGGYMLYLMIVALYPHHTHSRSTLYIYKVFQYILHTSSLSISLCSLMKLKHIPVSTQYLCMLASIWPSIKIKVECSQKPLIWMDWMWHKFFELDRNFTPQHTIRIHVQLSLPTGITSITSWYA